MHRILHTTLIGEDIALERRYVNRTCRISVFPILRFIRVLNDYTWPIGAIGVAEICPHPITALQIDSSH